MKKQLTIILSLLLLCPPMIKAQKVAVKTNLLYAATTTPNLGVEWAPGNKITLDLQGSYNGWEFGHKDANKKIKHWLIRPELRFWIYEKFDGHFLGIHPFYIHYNTGNIHLPAGIWKGLKENRYQGYGTGAGFGYGYQYYLGHHWNIEFQFGFGYAYLNYDRCQKQKCGKTLAREHKHYFGPTKATLAIVYLFKSRK